MKKNIQIGNSYNLDIQGIPTTGSGIFLPHIITNRNPLLACDVYKMGHMEQMVPGCTKVYAALIARSDKVYKRTIFTHLQYLVKNYLSVRLTPQMAEEFLAYAAIIHGSVGANGQVIPKPMSPEVQRKIRALASLGYFPVRIKAVPEGTVMPTGNVLMTVESTVDGFGWVVGFVESVLLKIWEPITTAAASLRYREIVEDFYEETVDEIQYPSKEFVVHDFGYRGSSCEEDAQITGAAHLLLFQGSDTVPALPFLAQQYGADLTKPIMFSIPASEHTVVCSFGKENEIQSLEHMLDVYKTGPFSWVADTYNVFRAIREYGTRLKSRILRRDGKLIFRPDSGNPLHIICGNPNAPIGSDEHKGVLRLLDEVFGSTLNNKKYKVLNQKIGLIYGDGMDLQTYTEVLTQMKKMGYAVSNLAIGVGRVLRDHTRDTFSFATKATYVEVNGVPREIKKDPITDPGKTSPKGLLSLSYEDGEYITRDQVTREEEENSLLELVFENGELLRFQSFEEIRARVQSTF